MLFAELLHEVTPFSRKKGVVTSLLQPSPTSGEASEWSGCSLGPFHIACQDEPMRLRESSQSPPKQCPRSNWW